MDAPNKPEKEGIDGRHEVKARKEDMDGSKEDTKGARGIHTHSSIMASEKRLAVRQRPVTRDINEATLGQKSKKITPNAVYRTRIIRTRLDRERPSSPATHTGKRKNTHTHTHGGVGASAATTAAAVLHTNWLFNSTAR